MSKHTDIFKMIAMPLKAHADLISAGIPSDQALRIAFNIPDDERLSKCPNCGYYAFNGSECFDCGYGYSNFK